MVYGVWCVVWYVVHGDEVFWWYGVGVMSVV